MQFPVVPALCVPPACGSDVSPQLLLQAGACLPAADVVGPGSCCRLRVAAQALWLACVGAELHQPLVSAYWAAPSWCFGNGLSFGLVAAVFVSFKA